MDSITTDLIVQNRTVNREPIVSVLMGVYRCSDVESVRRTIASLVAQTFEDWELLVVDDGSNDSESTFNILRNFAEKDKRITPLRYEDNRGLAYALNYGLSYANGKYIARQDIEDYSSPNRLQEEFEFLESHQEFSIVGSEAALFDDSGEWGYLNLEERPTKDSFLWNSPFIHPSVMMRADDLRAVGGYRVAQETLRGQDYDLFMRMYASGFIGANIPKPLYSYYSDRNEMKFAPMARRIQEARIRLAGFKALGYGISSAPYVVKPIVLGLIPRGLYCRIKRKQHHSQNG